MTREDKLLLLAYIDEVFAQTIEPTRSAADAAKFRELFLNSPDTLVRGRHFVGGDVGTINAPQFRERYRPTPNEGG